MRTTSSRAVRLVAAVGLVAATVVAGLSAPAAGHHGSAQHLDGGDNVAAALSWSQLAHDEATDVLLGRDDLFADSLASGALQGVGPSPLLLTSRSSLDPRVADELERLGTSRVRVLGGDAAISPAVVDELEELGMTVSRHAGRDRIETAVAIAELAPPSSTALLVRGFAADPSLPTQAFADSLAAGAWAAETGWPILLTETDALSAPTAAHIQAAAYATVVVGGTAAVSAAVEDELEELGATPRRVAGVNRFATAAEIARERSATNAGPSTVLLVDGADPDAWADGFAAASAGGSFEAPILLSNPTGDLPVETRDRLESVGDEGEHVELVCGATTDPAACSAAAYELGVEPPPGPVTVVALVLGGLHYPDEQFFVEPAHVPYCDAPHYHSSDTVYPVEGEGAALANPPDCGFGRVGEVTERTIEVSRADWEAYRLRTD